MKTKIIILSALALATALPVAAKPAVPQAPVITYGLIRDEYGSPMTSASSYTLRLVKDADRDGRVYAACAVGDSGIAGMNYRLSLEIDSAGPSRECAVVTNTVMFIRAFNNSTEMELRPVSTFITPSQGTKQRLDFAVGSDDDEDGMPDSWEEQMLEYAGRDTSPAAILAFRPSDDADGDGMSNYAEFLAGTDPFLETDLLKVESFELMPGTNRAKVTFYTVTDRKYRILMAESLTEPVWTPVATAKAVSDELAYENYGGTGHLMTVYVDARLSPAFFRVAAN